jgi:hypothetical protein
MDFPANGDLSAAQILQIKLKAEQMWADSQLSQEYIPHADAAIAVLKNQTARFDELTNKNIDNTVKVTFINPCGIGTQDPLALCDLDGQEFGIGGIDYALDLRQQTVGFKINAEKLRTSTYTFEELAAQGMLQHVKALDEWWAKQVLLKLKAYSGINVAVASGDISASGFTFANNVTEIPADAYNVSLLAKLMQQSIVNRQPAGYIIDDGQLFQPITNSKIDRARVDANAGDGQRADVLDGRVTFDMFNFKTAGLTEDMFIANPGAIAFKTKTRNPDAPTLLGGKIQQTVYTVPSRVLPGVKYDVFYQLTCVTNGNQSEYVHVWNFETRGGIFLNPNGCPVVIGGNTYTQTGVIAYERQAA